MVRSKHILSYVTKDELIKQSRLEEQVVSFNIGDMDHLATNNTTGYWYFTADTGLDKVTYRGPYTNKGAAQVGYNAATKVKLKMTDKHNFVREGSVVVEATVFGGNLKIYMSHTPSNCLVVERADFDDLENAVKKYLSIVRQKG